MGKYIDITGKRFGKLVAIKPTGRKSGSTEYWLCKCNGCGEEVEMLKNALRCKSPAKMCKKCAIKVLHVYNTKHFGCMNCGSDKHYAKGYCRNCYEKFRRETLQ